MRFSPRYLVFKKQGIMSYQFNRRGRSFRPRHQSNNRRPQRSSIPRSHYVSTPVAPIQEEAYLAVNTFADFGLHEQLLANVMRRGYSKPTPIQDQAIPVLMSGKDVGGIANTGAGKTAAFLLPLIDKLLKDPNQGVLILAPTRELALQIQEELKAFLIDLPLGTALCIGGMNINRQILRLKDKPHFVIGTPGRVKDLINRHKFKTALFTNIVLDEVDRMLDIGFRHDILFLISKLPPQRHAALFSATMDRGAEAIMKQFLKDPVTISVKKRESALQIYQDIVTIKPGENKVDVLCKLLFQKEFNKVIVFGRTKRGINKLEKQLYDRRLNVSAIHGNKTQSARKRSLLDFKQGRVQALLATDVVARGIDVDDVSHVINFDEPLTYEDYIHRIGRTGRAGKVGKALTFIS